MAYADRVGRGYAGSSADDLRKALGQYLTPAPVATFMASHARARAGKSYRILDPGAGAGILASAAIEALVKRPSGPESVHIVAFECDSRMAKALTGVLAHATNWAAERGVAASSDVHTEDFVLAESPKLARADALGEGGTFDLVISNPPYLKVPKDDPRAKAAASVVHGQPNLYGFFLAIGSALLVPGGRLIFITPRSYAAGPYFRLLRERLFSRVKPRALHLFGARDDAFSRDQVLQENVILVGERQDGWIRRDLDGAVLISHSAGIADLETRVAYRATLGKVVDTRAAAYVLRIPTSASEERTLNLVDSWPGRLDAYGWDISTGPVVPFRSDAVDDVGSVPATHAPLLWMQNVRAMRAEWPVVTRKAQYLRVEKESASILLPNRNYVLMRRFSAKEELRRLVAAPLLSHQIPGTLVAFENHLNYIHKPNGGLSEAEVVGLAALLNSAVLDAYFRVSNGNTQVSATELRAMPLPPREAIEHVGRRVKAAPGTDVNVIVHEVLADHGVAPPVPHARYG